VAAWLLLLLCVLVLAGHSSRPGAAAAPYPGSGAGSSPVDDSDPYGAPPPVGVPVADMDTLRAALRVVGAPGTCMDGLMHGCPSYTVSGILTRGRALDNEERGVIPGQVLPLACMY
jgi:hypothetical protein